MVKNALGKKPWHVRKNPVYKADRVMRKTGQKARMVIGIGRAMLGPPLKAAGMLLTGRMPF